MKSLLRDFKNLSSPSIIPSVPPSVSTSVPPSIPTRFCSVCTSDKATTEFLKITGKCQHRDTVCKESHIMNVISGNGSFSARFSVGKPPCPAWRCNNHLEGNDVQKFVTKEQYNRWDTLAFIEWSEAQPDFRWCSSRTCGAGQFVVGGEEANSFFTCSKCKAATCITHRVPMHNGISCDEYDKTLAHDEAAIADWKAKHTKPCPKCTVAIEKNGGCDHMTCKTCKHEFCWSCSADYEGIRKHGNHFHNQNCRFYAAA